MPTLELPATAAVLTIPLVLAGELRGAFFEGDCQRPGADIRLPNLASLVPNDRRPIVLATGDLLGPAPLLGRALEGPRRIKDRLLGMLRGPDGGALFDAVLPGEFELSANRSTLALLNRRGRMPWTVANIPLPAEHRKHRVFVRGGVRVGLTAVVDESLTPAVDPLNNLAIDSAAEALADSLRVLREAGVHLTVAMLHVRKADGLPKVLKILKTLTEPPPDLVLTSPLEGDLAVVRLGHVRSAIVPSPQDGSQASLIEFSLKEGSPSVKVRRVPIPAKPSEAADIVRNWACRKLDVPLDMLGWTGPIDRDAFQQFVLERMRQLGSAEIAVISSHTLGHAEFFPLPPSPTRLHIRSAVPFDEGLQVAEIRGSALGRFDALLRDNRVVSIGLSRSKVAGRNRDPRRIYRVVAVDFIASGGDGVLDAKGLGFKSLDSVRSLRDMIVSTLETQGFDPDADPDTDTRISEPGLLDLRLNLGANFKSVNVENRARAEASQLIRQNFLGLSGDLEVRLALDLPKHRFELGGRTRFGVIRESTEEEDTPTTRENEDVTVVELGYSGRLAGGQDRPWLPNASANIRLDTEFTIPEERNYRRALLQLGVGPSWQLAGNLALRSQLGLRRELFASARSDDPAEASLAETRVAFLSTAELRDEIFESYAHRPVVLNMRLDFAADLSGQVRDQVLEGRVGFDVPITNFIALTAALDVYLLSRSRRGESPLSGAALDTSFGIKSTTDFSRVMR